MSEKKPTPPQASNDKKTSVPPVSASPSAPQNPPAKQPDSAKNAASPSAPPPAADKKPEADQKPDSKPAAAAAGKKPDPKPATPPPVQRAPEAKPASGKGLSGIALAVAAVALALSGYQFLQNAKLASQLNDQRAVLQKEAARLDAADQSASEQLAVLRSDVAAIQLPAPGMDRDSVVKTIAENLAKAEKTFADTLDKRFAALPQGLSREDVQSQIKQALATFAQGSQPTIDFSDEIAKVQASEATAKQILAQIEGQAAQFDNRVQQALADAQKQLAALADSRASTLNLVTLAQLVGHAGQYQAAAQYLQQAAAHLAAGDNAEWQSALADAAQRFRQLASQPAPHAAIDHLIARVGEWPIRNSGASNLIAPDAGAAPQTLLDKVKHVGREIIAHTVTVVPLDDEGLAWINANPALQNIIRQNVRLDLAFARNALHMQDSAAYASIAATLKTEIERYFDASNAEVKNALETLARLESAQHTLPDLAPLIQALRNGQ